MFWFLFRCAGIITPDRVLGSAPGLAGGVVPTPRGNAPARPAAPETAHGAGLCVRGPGGVVEAALRPVPSAVDRPGALSRD